VAGNGKPRRRHLTFIAFASTGDGARDMTLYFALRSGHLIGFGSDALIRKFPAVATAGN
jgi:hypothetical protein